MSLRNIQIIVLLKGFLHELLRFDGLSKSVMLNDFSENHFEYF